MRNLSRDPVAQEITYRVEITGTDALSDGVKQVIAETAAGHELSRVGQQALRRRRFRRPGRSRPAGRGAPGADPALEIKVVEVPNS